MDFESYTEFSVAICFGFNSPVAPSPLGAVAIWPN